MPRTGEDSSWGGRRAPGSSLWALKWWLGTEIRAEGLDRALHQWPRRGAVSHSG